MIKLLHVSSPYHAILCLILCLPPAALARQSELESRWCPSNPISHLEKQSKIHYPSCPQLVDDKSDRDVQLSGPWTLPPYCVYPAVKDSSSRKHCVYTYTGSNGESGISLISPPTVASFIAGLLLARPEPWGHAPSYQSSPPELERRVSVQEIPGKGKGLVANSHIRKGDVILKETPVLLGFADGVEGIRRQLNPLLLKTAVRGLPERQQSRLDELAVTTGGEYYEDVLRTNSFTIEVDNTKFSALFPDIAVCSGCLGHVLEDSPNQPRTAN